MTHTQRLEKLIAEARAVRSEADRLAADIERDAMGGDVIDDTRSSDLARRAKALADGVDTGIKKAEVSI